MDQKEMLVKSKEEAIEIIKSNMPTSGYQMLQESLNMAIEALTEVQWYREIGTVEECVEARGKRMPILVKNRTIMMDFHGHPYLIRGDCPKCGSKALMSTLTDYCNACGQHLKWSDTEEKCESGKEDE